MARGTVVAVLAVLGLVAWLQYRSVAGDRATTRRLTVETGPTRRNAGTARQVGGEPDPTRARVALARALLAESLSPGALAVLPVREAERGAVVLGEDRAAHRGGAAGTVHPLPCRA